MPGGEYCRWHQLDPRVRPSSGSAFEERVKKILRLLGYNVERNVTIFGSQIDLYAEIRIGVINVRLMVECKEYSEQQVGIEEVNKFAGTLAVARNSGAVDKGLIVTTRGFSREAKTHAKAAGIELATMTELSTQLVDFSDLLNRTIKSYQDLPVSSRYIDIAGSEEEDYGTMESPHFIRPIDEYINRFLLTEGPDAGKRLAMLGNFGTGKSTFCRKYAHDLAQQYLQDPTRRIPVLISLSDYDWRFDIQHLLLQSLTGRYEVAISNAICQELQRQGRFLIILDGLDEMATRVDADTIEDNVREIAKLTLIENNRILLSCRTHFFRDKIEAQHLRDFGILFIPEWGPAELEEYLRKVFAEDWEKKLALITNTHNLSELAQTPLFLEMIVESLPELGDSIERTRLYEVYTDRWVSEQSQRKGARLRADDRRRFIRELAVGLWLDDRHTRHYREFGDLLRSRFQVDDAAQVDYLRSDVQTCTFLTRDSDGNYGFRHRSFLEFFVARAVADGVDTEIADLLSRKVLSIEIRGFVADLLRRDRVADTLKRWIAESDEILRENALALATLLRVELPQDLISKIKQSRGDVQLAASLVQGDSRAFEDLYVRYVDRVRRYISQLARNQQDADEFLTDVFLRIWRKGEDLDQIQNLDAYILRVARSVWLDSYRARRRYEARFVDIDLDRFDVWDSDAATEEIQSNSASSGVDISDLLEAIPFEQREIVRRYVFERESFTKIGAELGMSPAAARMSYARAVKALRAAFAEGGSDNKGR